LHLSLLPTFQPQGPSLLPSCCVLPQARRGNGLLRGGGRLRGEAEEREFRRLAAALNIQISPYFRRGGGGAGGSDGMGA